MTVVVWNKIFRQPGNPVEFVVNSENYEDTAPPTETAPPDVDPGYYYMTAEDDGVRIPVGPGCIKYGSAYYGVLGIKLHDPSGTAQQNLFDQIANPT